MFKAKYCKDMESVQPSAKLENNILNNMGREKARQPKKRIKMLWTAPVALVTCCAIIVGLFFGFGGSFNFSADIETAKSYDEVFAAVKKLAGDNYDWSYNGIKGGMSQEAATDSAVPPGNQTSAGRDESSSDSEDYSGTNVQVEGVDEADVIKTDGTYIYMMNGAALAIFKADGAASVKLSTTDLQAIFTSYFNSNADNKDNISVQAQEMYVYGDRLVIIGTVWESSNYYREGMPETVEKVPETAEKAPENDQNASDIDEIAPDTDGKSEEICIGCWWYSRQTTTVVILDVSDRANPAKVSAIEMDGWYASSRMVEGIVAIITNHYVSGVIDSADPSTFVPCVTDIRGERTLAAKDIVIANDAESANYILASTFKADGSGELISSKAVFGTGNTVYATTSNIYIAGARYINEEIPVIDGEKNGTHAESYSVTDIYRISNDKGVLEFTGSGSVPGTLINQFAMDEQNGYFRVVTTQNTYSYTYYTETVTDKEGNETVSSVSYDESVSKTSNGLYILDSSLEIVGKLDNLAEGETVYSVRFDGNIGYFVTFRRVDPLFSVDLSNPNAPVLLGALKIPGFSEYMHPYGEGLLLGLGQNADEEGRVTGLKLSMFNVSDPTNVSEADCYRLDGSWSEAEYNHKAILVSESRNIIAFPGDNCYYIFSYGDSGFSLTSKISLKAGEEWYWSQMRGLFIGNTFYVCDVQSGILAAYEIGSYDLLCLIDNAYVSK